MDGMTVGGAWSIDELVELAAAALAVGYAGTPTGRARDLPDVRAVRWYVTRGLVDRPLVRGRFARYGRRHLLQLVAIKRRQAEGCSLADIQAELAGAPDGLLEEVAGLPAELSPDGQQPQPPRPASRGRFWAAAPAPAAAPEPTPAGGPHEPAFVQSVSLAPGVTLLVDAALGPLDADAARRAAAALLDLIGGGQQ
jgi:DNA-binding transcriptional MerR regulator